MFADVFFFDQNNVRTKISSSINYVMTYLKIKISTERSFNRLEMCLLMCFSLIRITYKQRSHLQSIMSMTYLKIKISTERSFNRFKMCLLMCVRMMILKQSKRRRTLFRRRKFDVLIRSI